MDLSNILKKYQETKKQNRQKQHQNQSEDIYASGAAEAENVHLSEILTKKLKAPAAPQAQAIYDACLAAVRKIYGSTRDSGKARDDEMVKAAQKAQGVLSGESSELVKLVLNDYAESQDSLIYHAANSGIIAMLLAQGLGMGDTACLDLGLAGFLHDIGLTEFPELIGKRDRLTEAEYTQIMEHPGKGHDLLNNMDTRLSRQILEAVYQEHERFDGSGYPRGLKAEAIGEYARIVGVADVYEALTHWRPYRKAYTASDAIKVLLDEKAKYQGKILKALIEQIGIFPAGVLVRLNTKEIALVLKANKRAPFKPQVSILFDASGKKLQESKQIDLSVNTVVYVEECVRIGQK